MRRDKVISQNTTYLAFDGGNDMSSRGLSPTDDRRDMDPLRRELAFESSLAPPAPAPASALAPAPAPRLR